MTDTDPRLYIGSKVSLKLRTNGAIHGTLKAVTDNDYVIENRVSVSRHVLRASVESVHLIGAP